MFLTQLAASVPVDVMPGEGDPTNQALPQQPLHPCLFPEAARFAACGSFAAATNPHDFSVGGCDFLGTSGQNIDNMRAYMDVASNMDTDMDTDTEVKTNLGARGAESLDLMASSLRWQHVAPSAPDTLACYPYKDRDPFYVSSSPHVYFAGNQPAFGARVVRDGDTKTLLVSVPTSRPPGSSPWSTSTPWSASRRASGREARGDRGSVRGAVLFFRQLYDNSTNQSLSLCRYGVVTKPSFCLCEASSSSSARPRPMNLPLACFSKNVFRRKTRRDVRLCRR